MEKFNIDVYGCDFCSKISRNAGAMGHHEARCKKNPKNIALCYSCKFFKSSEEQKEICYPTKGGDESKVKFFKHRCTKFDLLLFNGLKWSKENFENVCNNSDFVPMPSEEHGCPNYEFEW